MTTPTEDALPPEADATPDEAFDLGWIAGYDEAMRERVEPPADDDREVLADRMRRASRAIYLATDATVADDISAMLTEAVALIEPPPDNSDDYLAMMSLAKRRWGGAQTRLAFEDGWTLSIARRQVSHPGPVTDAERPYSESTDIEYGAWETDDIEEHAHDMLAVVRYRRVALEAARDVRLPVPEEENP